MKLDFVKLRNAVIEKKALLEIKEGRNIFYPEIAKKIGVSYDTFRRAIKGEFNPLFDTVVKITRWLEKPIDEFISEKDS